MKYEPQNVLITGGCGFIGSNFINFIHNVWSKCKFVNVDKLILNSDTQNVDEKIRNSSRYKLALADIKNQRAMADILESNQIDTIIHFAADCTSTRCYNETIEAIENNVIAFIEFLEVVHKYGKVKRFVHISTDEVYGDSDLRDDEVGKLEESRLQPGNPYAATKIAGEAYVRAFMAQYKMPFIIARLNNIYGPNQWNIKVVPRFIEIAKVRGEYTIQGSGKQMRSWLYVDDASTAIQKTCEKGKIGEIYNLGTYFEKNVVDLAHVIQNEVDRQLGRETSLPRFISIPDRPYNDMRYLIDISKAEKELGWSPQITFEEGIEKTVASALQEKHGVKMHVTLYGGKGYVGQALQEVLSSKKIPYVLAKSKVGVHPDDEVEEELSLLNVTHVVCVTGRTHGKGINTIEYLEGGPERVAENVRDNMYSATVLAHLCRKLGIHFTYVGTGYIFAYDDAHPIGGQAFTENDIPTFFGSSYSVVKGFTDRQMSYFNEEGWETINARITLPLTFDLNQPRNLLSKIIHYKEIFDLPVSISILPDCFEAMVSLMEKRFGGNLNLVNPGPISLYEIVRLYKDIVDPTVDPTPIGITTERGRNLLATKGNCALDTSLLEKLVNIPSTRQSLIDNFKRMTK
ncbi:putative dTDP-glucose 4,6-dehydratase [Dictyocaulus viviparus]|uniref:dTDP-D-glucose 4,6-dehydratase n=1 Tax=Dictyocaulus viviparus TaxID=29172 RepID=A0A0D8XQR6_DICVI|nr:putative dTDP-glucose 4,6-dehydratase [Dictyocaulus viviparus]